MGDSGDVAARLADGEPAVEIVQQYVWACRQLGYQHPDLTLHAGQLRDWYDSEAGMDLQALEHDCAALEAVTGTALDVLELQERQADTLAGAWQGAGAVATSGFLRRHAEASAATVAALRTAGDALHTLREALWNAVDVKVEAVIAIEGRAADMREQWSAAAATVTTGMGDRGAASELVDQAVRPFVVTAIGTDWLVAMRHAMSSVADAYQRATAEIVGESLPEFEVPGELGPPWSAPLPGGDLAGGADHAPAAAAYPSGAGDGVTPVAPAVSGAAPATTPAAWTAPIPPAMPAEPVTPGLPSWGSAGSPIPGLGGGLSGLAQPFTDALSGLLGGAGAGDMLPGSAPLDMPDLDRPDIDLEEPDDDPDGEPAEDGPDGEPEDDDPDGESGDDDPDGEPDDLGEDGVADDEPSGDPDVDESASPAPTLPPPPPPAEPLPPVAEPVAEDRTPCEVAADELPQVGEPSASGPGGG